MLNFDEKRELAERLVDRDKTLDLLQGVLDAVIRNVWNDALPLYMNQLFRNLAEKLKEEWEYNINLIFDCAESPIELIFLNTFCFYCIVRVSPRIIFVKPFSNLDEAMEVYREQYKYSMEAYQVYLNLRGIEEPDSSVEHDFIQFTMKNEYLDRDVKIILLNQFMNYFQSGWYNLFHCSLQSSFKEIKLNGKSIRPDLVIWVPGEPKIKIVVECDGYTYHSDKTTFSTDRARDRLLLANGYKVLRFSGSEIYKDPIDKAGELHSYLVSDKECEPFVERWLPVLYTQD